jgi:hypothetical protein
MPPSVASLRRVAAMDRNAWPESTGTGGRLTPELMAGMTGIRRQVTGEPADGLLAARTAADALGWGTVHAWDGSA